MPKLTANFINTKVQPPTKGKDIFYRDSELIGFGLRVRESSMVFFVEKRVNGVNRRVNLGKYPLLSPEQARYDALAALADMAKGNDPVRTRDIGKRTSPTLQQAFDEYMSHERIPPGNEIQLPQAVKKELGDWLDMSVTAITRGMVADRFKRFPPARNLELRESECESHNGDSPGVLNFVSIKYEVNGEPLLPSNPVTRLTQTRAWHRLPQRQGTIPDHRLPAFYQAVQNLVNPNARDYFIVLLLTGLRRNEAAQLRWTDIDFEAKTLTLQSTIAKNGYEHKLPLSTQLFEILSRRHAANKRSEYRLPGLSRQRPVLRMLQNSQEYERTVRMQFHNP